MENRTTRAIPSSSDALRTLLRADMTSAWRQRRAMMMSLIVPIIFLVSWKSLVAHIGGPAVFATCLSIGLPGIGLMGYSISLARDRERGVFQRLRAAPVPTWAIMTSRIAVQLVMIVVMTIVAVVVAVQVDKIPIDLVSAMLAIVAALVGGLSFLALGQLVVAFVLGSEAVNSASRLIYFPLAVLGAIGQIGLFGQTVENIVTWSPLGTTKTILAAALAPGTIDVQVFFAFLATLGYAVVFAAIGIKYFRWTVA